MTHGMEKIWADVFGLRFSSQWRHRRATRRSAGFTLAEVAVALAIFVFGALAIVRIFPPALDVIRNSESRTTATMLAQSTNERLRRETNLLPDAIFDADYLSPTPPATPYAGAFTGTASRKDSKSLPSNLLPSTFNDSALGHFKQISGEKQIVRSNANAAGEIFVLTQYPYNSVTGVSVYRETIVSGVSVDSAGVLYRNDTQYSDATANTTFYASYRWTSGGQYIGGVIDEPLKIPTAPAQVFRGVLGESIDAGPITLRRRELLGTFSNANNMTGYVPVTGANVGDTVSLDYSVVDWRWLVDDKTPTVTPANIVDTPTDVADYPATARIAPLPVRTIDEQSPVWGLLAAPDVYNPTTVQSVQVGQWNQNAASAPFLLPAAPTADQQQRKVELLRKNGQAVYDSGGIIGARARTVYRAVDGWAHQLSVAARSYIPYIAGRTAAIDAISPQERWREYSWKPGATHIYFHPNEAGKTIMVTYRFGAQIADSLVTIDQKLIDASSVNLLTGFEPDTVNGKVAVVVPLSNVGTGNPLPIDAVLAVRGLGVQARTAWINGDRYSQAVVSDYRRLD